jgi:prepilin-type N-terminal cleavage/methylation domain-containing protein
MKRSSAGFTLVELLLVISLMSIIATIMFAKFDSVLPDTRDTRRKADLRKTQTALTAYYFRNKSYPQTTANTWYVSDSGAGFGGGTNGGNWIPGLAPTFIPTLPKDPRGGTSNLAGCSGMKRIFAYRSDDGTQYKLMSYCGIESGPFPIPTTDPFYDPVAGRSDISWMVCEGDTACKNW